MSKHRLIALTLVAASALALTGCGGSGSGNYAQFSGLWSGTYQITQSGVESSGNMTVEIDNFGNVVGTLNRTDSNPQTVNLRSAFITGDRELRFVFNYSNTNDRQVIGHIERNGNILRDESGLHVSFAGGSSGTFTMNLVRQNN